MVTVLYRKTEESLIRYFKLCVSVTTLNILLKFYFNSILCSYDNLDYIHSPAELVV